MSIKRNQVISMVLFLILIMVGSVAGCATRSSHHASSVVQYLYPEKLTPSILPAFLSCRYP